MKIIESLVIIVILLGVATWVGGQDIEGEQVVAELEEGWAFLEFVTTNSVALGDEILVLEDDGDIYWRGRLVTTDRELVSALNDVIFGFKCHKCRERLGEEQ